MRNFFQDINENEKNIEKALERKIQKFKREAANRSILFTDVEVGSQEDFETSKMSNNITDTIVKNNKGIFNKILFQKFKELEWKKKREVVIQNKEAS